MNKALLDTDIYSEVLKANDPIITADAVTYRQSRGILSLQQSRHFRIPHTTLRSWLAEYPA